MKDIGECLKENQRLSSICLFGIDVNVAWIVSGNCWVNVVGVGWTSADSSTEVTAFLRPVNDTRSTDVGGMKVSVSSSDLESLMFASTSTAFGAHSTTEIQKDRD